VAACIVVKVPQEVHIIGTLEERHQQTGTGPSLRSGERKTHNVQYPHLSMVFDGRLSVKPVELLVATE
jgi:hypothetical protein